MLQKMYVLFYKVLYHICIFSLHFSLLWELNISCYNSLYLFVLSMIFLVIVEWCHPCLNCWKTTKLDTLANFLFNSAATLQLRYFIGRPFVFLFNEVTYCNFLNFLASDVIIKTLIAKTKQVILLKVPFRQYLQVN